MKITFSYGGLINAYVAGRIELAVVDADPSFINVIYVKWVYGSVGRALGF